jgi:type I restriction enzyme S subunit
VIIKAVQAPDGWKPAKLKDAAQINPRSNSVDDDSLVTFLPMTAVSESGIIQGAEIRIAIDVKKGFTSFETGDVLVAKITPCFENYKGCLCTELKNDRGYGSTEFHVLRPKKNITGEYLHILTRTHHFRGTGELNMTGTAGQKRVPTIFLKNYDFHLPPLPEQKAIADLLSTWDEAIEKTERLIQAKEEWFKSLMRELISEPQNAQKVAKWKKVRIGSFLTESRIAGSNGFEAQKITVKLYGKGVIPRVEKRIGSATTQYYTRKAGQFIYSKLDFLNGAFGIIPDQLDGFESTLDLPAFDISDNVSKEWFLYYLIRPEYYTRQLGLAKGQRKARRVNPAEFLNSKITLPPLDEQRRIAAAISSAQHEIDLLKQLAEKYKTQKRGLMQKMLTGEWRVKPEIVNQYMEA